MATPPSTRGRTAQAITHNLERDQRRIERYSAHLLPKSMREQMVE